MGQLFNLSKMDALEGMMLDNIAAFVQALRQKVPRPIEVVQACRALEADIVGECFAVLQANGEIAKREDSLLWIRAGDWCSSFVGK